jgi:hypothetical protein
MGRRRKGRGQEEEEAPVFRGAVVRTELTEGRKLKYFSRALADAKHRVKVLPV